MNFDLGRLWAGTEDSLLKLLSMQMPEGKGAFFDDGDGEDQPSRLTQRVGNVGVLHVKGPLLSQGNFLTRLFGMASYDDVRQGLVELAQDDEVGTIMLNMDTPGGAVSGLSDVSDLVAAIDTNIKPVLAHTSGMMASAGYHIGSSARRITAGRMADVGSIGVLQIHREASKLEERMGVTTTVFRAGEQKALGNPYEPLSDKAKAVIQESCDYSYDLFVKHVADARGVTPETVKLQMADGKVFTGEQARAVNLVDDICTFDEALQFAANFRDVELHKSESLPQYGSSTTGLTSMKKATLNPLTAAAQAMLAAGEQEQANLAAKAGEAQAEAVQAEAAEAQPVADAQGGDPVPAAPEAPSAVSVLQGQLAQAQEQLLDLKIELRDANKRVESMTATNKGMRAVVEQSVQYLRVALNQGAGTANAMSDDQLLSEHDRLHAQFDANFKAGGVAAVSVTDTQSGDEGADPVRLTRLKAARLTHRK